MPGKKDEEWQFTDLSQLWAIDFRAPQTVTIDKNALAVFLLPEAKNSRLVFVNGIYQPELSDISALPLVSASAISPMHKKMFLSTI
ncbi:MAG UNVERIFIED_CONTAM: hypothetical protein LVR29_24210 [Microcystis novacekii LVE1205-3]